MAGIRIKVSTDEARANTAKLRAEFNRLGTQTKVATKEMSTFSRMGSTFSRMGTQIAAAFTIYAAISLGKKMYSISKEYETALVDMGKVTGRTLKDISADIKTLGPELGSQTELMKGYYQTISAGIAEPAKALEFLTVASRASKAAHVEQAEVVKGLSKILAGFGGEVKSVTEASDLLFMTEKQGQTDFGQLVPIIGGVSAISKLAGVSANEMAAALSLMTQTAGSTSIAATQYKAIMVGLFKPQGEMIKLLKEEGYASGKAMIQSLGFAGALELIRKKAKESGLGLGKFIISSEALVGLGPLMQNNFTAYNTSLEVMKNKTGASKKAFEEWAKTAEASGIIFSNTMEEVMRRFGNIIMPRVVTQLNLFSDWVKENESEITDFFDDVEEGVTSVTAAVKAIYHFVNSIPGEILSKGLINTLLSGSAAGNMFTTPRKFLDAWGATLARAAQTVKDIVDEKTAGTQLELLDVLSQKWDISDIPFYDESSIKAVAAASAAAFTAASEVASEAASEATAKISEEAEKLGKEWVKVKQILEGDIAKSSMSELEQKIFDVNTQTKELVEQFKSIPGAVELITSAQAKEIEKLTVEENEKAMLGRIDAERNMYEDMRGYSVAYYKAEKLLIENQASAYEELGIGAVAIKVWTTEEMEKLDIQVAQSGDNMISGIKAGWEDWVRTQSTTGRAAFEMTQDAINNTADALTDFVETGKLDFKSLVDSILSGLVRIQMRALLVAAIGGDGSGGELLGSIIGSVASIVGGVGGVGAGIDKIPIVFHGGGVVGKDAAPTRLVPEHVFANAPRAHAGLGAGERAIIAKDNESIFTEGQTKALGLMVNQNKMAEPPIVNIEIKLENKSSQPIVAKKGDMKSDIKKMVIGIILEDYQSRGALRQSGIIG